MPDFDTRKPQEPNEPSKPRIVLIANSVRNLLIASRLRTLLIGGGILLFVVILPVGLLISTPSWLWPDDQAKVPEYRAELEYRDCIPVAGLETEDVTCYDVVAQAHDAESLALITRDIARGEDGRILSVVFYTGGGRYTGGTVFFPSPFARRTYKRDYGDDALRRAKVIDGVYVFRSLGEE